MRNLAFHTLAILGLGVMPLGRCDGFSAISTVLKLSNPPSIIMLGKTSIIQGVPRCRRQWVRGLPGCEAPVAAQDSTPRRCTARVCMGSHTARAAAGSLGTAAAAAVLRGGAMEHNVIAGVLGELANIRTPAALLGGAALGTMFFQPKADANRRLHLLYTLLSTSAFSLQLVCVLCSTLTYTSIASRPEAIAISAISYLSEQMQWEFFVIRGSFVYGLFSFLAALVCRGWLTFYEEKERGPAWVIMAVLASSAIFLLNFIHYTHNSLTLCLGGMTKALISLTLRNMYATKKRFIRHVLAAFGIWGAVKLLKLEPSAGAKRSAEQGTAVSTAPPPQSGREQK
ncbi:unnamed protein product [Ectocarpus sp. CCAP 1310/34]|nr:unnamed protein product [Ectocarpus sp. CCAP 1310/34]